MHIKVLGCSGGIGAGLKTTAILIDNDTAIDAGTGIGDLTLEELRKIRRVFLTHSHIDHVAGLPLFLDSVFDYRIGDPLELYARAETIQALKDHIFNDVIWPDFSVLPYDDEPVMRYNVIEAGQEVQLGDRLLTAVDVHHSVPSLGYCIQQNGNVFAFSGDTRTNRSLWPVLNSFPSINVLIIEVSFPNYQEDLAQNSGHYCPSTLAEDMQNLEHNPDIWVTAMKPGEEELIMEEVISAMPGRNIKQLKAGDEFVL